MNTYSKLFKLSQTRKRKLGNNTYLVVRSDGGFGVKLHDTEVVIHYPDKVVLNSGGYQTRTTKSRMNDYSDIYVYSEGGVWFANEKGRYRDSLRGHVYADGITFHADGRVSGTAKNNPKEIIQLRNRVNKYAKAYADAFLDGNIPKPNGGDCWACLMVSKSGDAPIKSVLGGEDHIHSHIEDNYFVPSILNRMSDAGTMSLMTKDYIARQWQGEPREPLGDMEYHQIYKTVRKFCLSELGLAV